MNSSEALVMVQRMQALFAPLGQMDDLVKWVQSAEGAAKEAQDRLEAAKSELAAVQADILALTPKRDSLTKDVAKLLEVKAAVKKGLSQVSD